MSVETIPEVIIAKKVYMFPPPHYSESSQGQINASTEEIKTVKIIVLFPSERFFIPGITEHKKLKVNPDKTAKKTGLDFLTGGIIIARNMP